MAGLYRALDSFAVGHRVVAKGEVLTDADPVVSRAPALFVRVGATDSRADAPVERATARPGEKRTTRRMAEPEV